MPNDQYLTPFVDVDRSGSRIFVNDTRELLMNGVADQPATLGRYFLTSAYLMVNHDANTFTLWRANPTTRSSLVRVMDEETARQCDDDSAVVQPPATSSPSDAPSSVPTKTTGAAEDSSVSGAVIGGAVAEGVMGIAMVAGGILLFLRRRKRRSHRVPSTAADEKDKPPAYVHDPYRRHSP